MTHLQILEKNTMQQMVSEKAKQRIDLMALASWLFLIGSLIFQLDAILELTEGISLHVAFHLSASLLFTAGSILFVMHDGKQK
jgi:thiosulfate reductase cytochrome b subunit